MQKRIAFRKVAHLAVIFMSYLPQAASFYLA
jgi:hypothetical protein